MARDSSALVYGSQYVAARLAAMGLTMFDVEDNLRTAAAIGRLMFRLDRRHRQRTLSHLAIAFPQLSTTQAHNLAKRSFEHFIQLVIEVLHTPHAIHQDSWSRLISLRNLSQAIEILNAGKPAIMLTGHLGNWEVLGSLMAVLGYPCEAIARPIDNPYINRWLLGVREKRGMRIITKWDATDRMVGVLKSGGVLGFIADQNAGDKGLFVPFFGKLASTYKSIALLAISQEVPIICGYARRLGEGYRYEMGVEDIIRPADWANQSDPLFYITARYMHAIERMIRLAPEQYLWMHRRWKSRPRHERQGKPMPASLRQNIEALPWIDASLMQTLSQPLQPA